MTEEEAFRRQLETCAYAADWAEWHNTRLVFADWLEEQGPERADEATATRLDIRPYLDMYGQLVRDGNYRLNGWRCPAPSWINTDGSLMTEKWRQWYGGTPYLLRMQLGHGLTVGVLKDRWLHFAPRSLMVCEIGKRLELDQAILLHRSKGRTWQDYRDSIDHWPRITEIREHVYPLVTLADLAAIPQRREAAHA